MNFIAHENDWSWGKSIKLISTNGVACVEMSFEKNNPGVCYISGLSVIPEYRRQGYATALMSICEQMCEERAIFRIDLNSVLTDYVMDFYHKLGYKDIEPGEEVMKMYKFIGDCGKTLTSFVNRIKEQGDIPEDIQKVINDHFWEML